MPTSPLATTNFHTSAQIRQVYDLIDIMSPREVPFLKLVGIDGEAGTNPKMEWVEDTLLAESSTLNGAISSTTATTFTVASGDGVNFQAGEVVAVDTEFFYVTAVNSDVLTVVRGVAGTTAATHLTAATVSIVGLANLENTASPVSGTTELVIPYNNFQAFDTSYQLSYLQGQTNIYGVPEGDDARELDKAFQQLVIKLERTAFLGLRRDAETVGGVSIPRLMGGLNYFFSSAYSSSFYTASLSSNQLQEKDINDMLQNRWQTVGAQNMGKTLLVNAWNKRRISDMFAPYARMDRAERTGGVVVDVIDTEWGPIDVVMSLRCPTSTVYLLNLDFLSIHPYQNLAFFDQELSRDGAYIKRQIYGVYTMRVRNIKSMGTLTSTATS